MAFLLPRSCCKLLGCYFGCCCSAAQSKEWFLDAGRTTPNNKKLPNVSSGTLNKATPEPPAAAAAPFKKQPGGCCLLAAESWLPPACWLLAAAAALLLLPLPLLCCCYCCCYFGKLPKTRCCICCCPQPLFPDALPLAVGRGLRIPLVVQWDRETRFYTTVCTMRHRTLLLLLLLLLLFLPRLKTHPVRQGNTVALKDGTAPKSSPKKCLTSF